MILDYVKVFLTLFLLVKILLYFVPKNVFEKYIAFFSGVILVIGLLYPLLQGLGQENKILDNLQYEQWEGKLLEIEQDAATVEAVGEQVLADYYGEAGNEDSEIESIVIETIKIEKEKRAGDVSE